MEARVNPAQRRTKQYPFERSNVGAVIDLTFLLPMGQGEQLRRQLEGGADWQSEGDRDEPRSDDCVDNRIAVRVKAASIEINCGESKDHHEQNASHCTKHCAQ